ncbi:hypothetical protein QR680_004365 [Steinernema hermaphroditum]|uniref:F-box domain-containing protein n=1 Tax=Steinernema hermaphroditum TaxID=289476 RepID=A0AA39LTW2_9BILA|nr:hypothetical protein QR680_004365 [Steinernema hermaphroditum]
MDWQRGAQAMNSLPDAAMEQLAGFIAYERLPKIARAVKKHAGWSEAVGEEKNNRFEVRMWIAVHMDLEAEELVYNALKYSFKDGYRRYDTWDLSRKCCARLSEVSIGEATKTELDGNLTISGRNVVAEDVSRVHSLFAELPVARGLDNFPTKLAISNVPKAREKAVAEVVKSLPTVFEYITVRGLREQPELLLQLIDRYKSNIYLCRFDVERCDLVPEILPVFASMFLLQRRIHFAAYFDMPHKDFYEEHMFRFPGSAVIEFVEKWRASNGICDEHRRTVGFWMEAAEWDAITATHERSTTTEKNRAYRIMHPSRKSSLEVVEDRKGDHCWLIFSIKPTSPKQEAEDCE